ncbi:hypothetical protein ACQKNX_08090 [Lysinibacillus sp. NPDC093712]|uniref:hypothetical protein n=1 Tax=Lysinibacillus sp. NPDC093712 TaxID=3390579 RepID=UPI003CFF4A8F
MSNINVKIVTETASIMLTKDNTMLDCVFINEMFFHSLTLTEQLMIASVYKETYNATGCLFTAKEKTEHTIIQLQSKLLTV